MLLNVEKTSKLDSFVEKRTTKPCVRWDKLHPSIENLKPLGFIKNQISSKKNHLYIKVVNYIYWTKDKNIHGPMGRQ